MNKCVLVNCDTDSIMIAKENGGQWTEEEQERFLEELNRQFPEKISWEHDGYYTEVVVVGSKNYALRLHKDWCDPKDLDENGNPKIKLKGSSIKDQKKEPAMREMMTQIIECLVYDRKDDILGIYKKYVKEAMNVTDISRWSSKKNVTRAVLDCEGWQSKVIKAQNKKGEWVDKTVYYSKHADNVRMNEIVVWEALKHIEGIQEGEKYYLYPAILETKTTPGRTLKSGKQAKDKVEEITGLKMKELWTQDQDKLKLVQRVFATIEIFELVLDMEQFIDYSLVRNKAALQELVDGKKTET
jgi:hypothetical protein